MCNQTTVPVFVHENTWKQIYDDINKIKRRLDSVF